MSQTFFATSMMFKIAAKYAIKSKFNPFFKTLKNNYSCLKKKYVLNFSF